MLHGYGYGVQKFCKNWSTGTTYIYKIKFHKFKKIKTKISYDKLENIPLQHKISLNYSKIKNLITHLEDKLTVQHHHSHFLEHST